MSNSRYLTLSAMFIALGVLFPIVFHAAGIANIFLPMFWPVAASLFFLPLYFAIGVGVLTPILSFLLTGMPPISPPIIYIMIIELFTLTLIGGLVYKYTRFGVFWVLLLAFVASRFSLFLAVVPLAKMLGLPPGIATIAYLLKGLPGIISVLFFVTIVLQRIKHEPVWRNRP